MFWFFSKNVSLLRKVIFFSMYPFLFKSILFIIFPFKLVMTEIPELDDLINGTPFSTDLKICAARCCLGPVVFPNQASLVILTNRLELFVPKV